MIIQENFIENLRVLLKKYPVKAEVIGVMNLGMTLTQYMEKKSKIEWAVREAKKAFHTKDAVLTLIGKVSQ